MNDFHRRGFCGLCVLFFYFFFSKLSLAAGPVVDIAKGKRIWMSACIQCHNRDPNIKGSIGPETVDAPLEVMMSKVMTGKYPKPLPKGFVPKRKTSAMRALPQHGKDVHSIWAYIQSVKKKK
jgi:hypothetical protein